jgi:hypothetical protein
VEVLAIEIDTPETIGAVRAIEAHNQIRRVETVLGIKGVTRFMAVQAAGAVSTVAA